MERKLININGQDISYLESEKVGKETILFLHGWGCDATIFMPIINRIKNKHIISIDFPGFGESEEPKSDWTVRDYAENILGFIKAKNLKNVTLVGHSFGGRVTFWLYSLGEKLPIKKVVLTGAAGIKPKRTWKYYASVLSHKFKKFLVKTPFYFQYKEDLFANAGSEDYKNATPKMKKVFVNVVNEDLTPLLNNVSSPTLLFWGDHDDATPLGDGYIMNEKINNSKLEIVNGTHYAFLEHQEAFTKGIVNNN